MPTVPVHITENGVAKVKAADILKTPEAARQLEAVRQLRIARALTLSPDLKPATHQTPGYFGSVDVLRKWVR